MLFLKVRSDEISYLSAAGPFSVGEVDDLDILVFEVLFIVSESFRSFIIITDEQTVEAESFPVGRILVAGVDDAIDIFQCSDDSLPLFERDERRSVLEGSCRMDSDYTDSRTSRLLSRSD